MVDSADIKCITDIDSMQDLHWRPGMVKTFHFQKSRRKILDVMPCYFPGLLINQKVLDIFLKHSLPEYIVHPVSVDYKGNKYDYFYFRIVRNVGHDIYDFEKSEFHYMEGVNSSLTLKNWDNRALRATATNDDVFGICYKYINSDYPISLVLRKAHQYLDYLPYGQFIVGDLITSKLYEALVIEKVTGLDFRLYDDLIVL